MKRTAAYIFMVVLALALCSGPAFAGNLKDRMVQRLPAINALKAQGAVGENNQGYLESLTGKGGDVVSAENADRRKVYQAIGRKQGVAPEFVGQRRAAQLRERARPGEKLQAPDGSWYRK
ncbi:YdbL family protein [Pseudodesulfovibrio tunisiensis]|uniref:YdbL family protein n=1 Tax=Pseudodesulfovibrio tunisiensis TaxID=463192 RepID=UPI001FB4A45C|nr:YdbL family protein [Pseudodesulfovibrio tunisiensis]